MTTVLNKMSDNLWNEASLLDRYQVFKYIYFIDIRPILLNHLKKLYDLYKKDLRSDFICQSFSQENIKTENIQIIETELLKSLFFRHHISQMKEIVFRNRQENPYSLPWIVLEENRRLHEKIKIEHYTALFTEISNYTFRYFLKMQFSISTLDMVIRSLNIKHLYDVHYLPCLVAAHFQLILHQQHSH